MKYKYFFDAIVVNRKLNSFIVGCDLGISETGIAKQVSFISDEKPITEFTSKVIDILESTKNEPSLELYFTNVTFNRAVIVRDDSENIKLSENTGKKIVDFLYDNYEKHIPRID